MSSSGTTKTYMEDKHKKLFLFLKRGRKKWRRGQTVNHFFLLFFLCVLCIGIGLSEKDIYVKTCHSPIPCLIFYKRAHFPHSSPFWTGIQKNSWHTWPTSWENTLSPSRPFHFATNSFLLTFAGCCFKTSFPYIMDENSWVKTHTFKEELLHHIHSGWNSPLTFT